MEAPHRQPPQDWEALFTPLAESLNAEYSAFGHVEEVELTGCAVEELSSVKGVTWESFYSFLNLPDENGGQRLVSVAPGVFLTTDNPNRNIYPYLLSSCEEPAYIVLPLETERVIWVWLWTAHGYEQVTSSCDFLLGLLSETDQPSASLLAFTALSPCPVSRSALESFLTKSNDNLTVIGFNKCIMKEDHFRGLGREGVSIILHGCTIDMSTSSFLNCLRKGLGPNRLVNCDIDPIVLGLALTTSNHIKELWIGKLELNDHSLLTIVRAVAGSESLLIFGTSGLYISDHLWSAICKSFRPHPTLKRLNLDLNQPPRSVSDPPMSAERIERRMNDVLSMLHVNSVLAHVNLAGDDSDETPLPHNLLVKCNARLEMNTNAFEDQCHSLGPVAPGLRPKLLGRALHMARLHPALLWKFLSEHLDVVVETAETRIFSKLDEASQKKWYKQADASSSKKKRKQAQDGSRGPQKKRSNRASS